MRTRLSNRWCLLVLALFLGAPIADGQQFIRGDSNGDGQVNIADPIHTLAFLFTNGPESQCRKTADGNDDGQVNIADAISVLGHLFSGGGPLPAPFPACGVDPTADSLDCLVHSPCGTFPPPPAPPSLDPFPEAVLTPTITISGISDGVSVRVASSLGQSTVPVVGGVFTAPDIPLELDGLTTIFFSSIGPFGNASSAVTAIVGQDSSAPLIVLSAPLDGATVTSEIVTVQGMVQDLLADFDTLTVTVDGVVVPLTAAVGGFGSFSLPVGPLVPAVATPIVVEATDPLGNTSSATVTVTYLVPPGPRLTLISGGGQTATVDTELPDPIVLRVTQPNGSPFPNKLVHLEVTGSNGRLLTTPGGPESIALDLLSDPQGFVTAIWRLGGEVGVGIQEVTATSSGIEDVIEIFATGTSAPPDKIVVATGSAQVLPVSTESPAPMIALVTDPSGNPIAGVDVTFTATVGESQVRAENGAPAFTVTVATDALGRARAHAVLGDEAGGYTFSADFLGNTSLPATFQLQAIASNPGQPTTFEGIVLSNASQPIVGAEVRLRFPGDGAPIINTALTDADGNFEITGITESGPAQLNVDGLEATAVAGTSVPLGSFPCLEFQVVIVEGAVNEIGMPAFLPPLDPQNARSYDGVQDLPLTIQGVPGVEIIVPMTTTITDEDGNPLPLGSIMALNRVNFDKIPMPLPDGAISSFAWTLQPSGLHFDPPLPVTLPNFGGIPAGTAVNMVSFNHSTHRFESFGPGRVSADGATITSDPGFGIEISGWGAPLPPPPPPAEVHNCSGDELWQLAKDGLKLVADLILIFGNISDSIECVVGIVSTFDSALSTYDTIKADGDLTPAEIASVLSTLNSLKSAAVECAEAFSPVGVASKLTKAQQIQQSLAAAIAFAQSENCLGFAGSFALSAVNLLNNWIGKIINLVNAKNAKDALLTSVCGSIQQLIDSLNLAASAPIAPGTTPTIADLDLLFANVGNDLTDLQLVDADLQLIIDDQPELELLGSDFQEVKNDLEKNPEIAGASVTIAGQTVIANEGGGFSIGNIPAGDNLLSVEVILEGAGGAQFARSDCFTLTAGEQRLIPPLTLVTDPVDVLGLEVLVTPAAIALGSTGQVQVIATFSDGTTADVTADSCLAMTISNPARADYDPLTAEVTTNGVGIFYVTAVYEGAIGAALASGIFPAPPLTDIVGLVTLSNGAPVSGATVLLQPTGLSTQTDIDGSFTFSTVLTSVGPFTVDIDGGAVVSDPFDGIDGGVTDAGIFNLGSGTALFVLGATGAAGSTITSGVVLDTDDVLSGWSVGLCHDPAFLTPIDAWSGGTTLVADGGAPPDFVDLVVDSFGITQGVIISLTNQNTLAPGVGYDILTAQYELGATPGTTDLCPCDTAGNPTVDTVVVGTSGQVLPVGQNCGTITIDP